MIKSIACTKGIRVEVASQYLPEHSNPELNHWFFAYTVNIQNEGDQTVKLVSRHWHITDANGHVQEIKGEGVIGKQPTLQPGQSFKYTSACPLGTSFGTMHGSYQMVAIEGERFDAEIAPFSLNEPHTVH